MNKTGEFVFKQMSDLYVWLTDRLPARQDGLFRTYLWSASLALTLNLLLLQRSPLWPRYHWQACSLLSALLALGVVIYCLWGLRGRSSEDVEHLDYSVVLSRMTAGVYSEEEAMGFLVDHMGGAIRHQTKIQSSRAKRLRSISQALTASFGLLLVAGVLFISP